MRASGGFGVILHTEDGLGLVLEAFQRLIVQVDMGSFHIAWQRVDIDRKPMVLGGDLNLVRELVQHRLIRPTVAELELERLATQSVA